MIDVYESGGKIIVEFYYMDILDEFLYELDVIDFGIVVSKIEIFKEGIMICIVVELNVVFKFIY